MKRLWGIPLIIIGIIMETILFYPGMPLSWFGFTLFLLGLGVIGGGLLVIFPHWLERMPILDWGVKEDDPGWD